VVIGGNVQLSAVADNHSGANAAALASLDAANINSIQVTGAVTIIAHGTNSGGGQVTAQGNAKFAHDTTVSLQQVVIDVTALNKGNHSGQNAVAHASLDATHVNNVQVQGGITIIAHGTNSGGQVNAQGNADFAHDTTLSLQGVGIDVAALNKGNHSGANAVADASLDATHVNNVQVQGGITINAHGTSSGGGQVNAQGIASFAHDITVNLQGVAIDVTALNKGNQGGANADASLHATHVNNLQVQGGITIIAHGTNSGGGQVNAQGIGSFANDTTVSLQDVVIDVAALNKGNGSGANANALFNADFGNKFSAHSLTFSADASSNGVGGANAMAEALIARGTVAIAGNVTLDAKAVTGIHAHQDANASANLDAAASVGNMTVAGALDIQASGSDHGVGDANAIAAVTLEAFSGANGVVIGALTDLANARDFGGGSASAAAGVAINAPRIHILGDADVSASALNNTGHGNNDQGAAAHAGLFLNDASCGCTPGAGGQITVDGDITIAANATNHGSGQVNASAGLAWTSGTVALHDVTLKAAALNLGNGTGGASAHAGVASASGVLKVSLHNLNVQADATSLGTGGARAQAAGLILGLQGAQASGDVTVNAKAVTGTHALGSAVAQAAGVVAAFNNQVLAGNIDVEALASDHGAGNAVSQALTAVSVLFGDGGVSVGSVTDKAVAKDSGPGSANASAMVVAGGATIQVAGNINITASALNAGGPGGTGLGAAALAVLRTSGLRSGINAQVTGDLNLTANAVNLGSGKVLAKGGIRPDGLSTVHVHNVAIDVAALNEGNGSGGASASAHFSASPALHLTMHGLSLHATASSHGGGGALASAGANIMQPTISIAGSIDITAFAHNGPGGAGGNQVRRGSRWGARRRRRRAEPPRAPC
jgi:hypothetical protein